jgi:hypothetical protein
MDAFSVTLLVMAVRLTLAVRIYDMEVDNNEWPNDAAEKRS